MPTPRSSIWWSRLSLVGCAGLGVSIGVCITHHCLCRYAILQERKVISPLMRLAQNSLTNHKTNHISHSAVIPIRIISQRTVAISFLFKAFLQVAMMAQAYYVPIYFQAVRSLSAQDSGLRTLIFGVTIAIATLAAGYLVTRLGYYVPFMFIGAAIFALGSGLLTTLKLDSGPEKWLSYQLVAGIGYGVPSLMPFYALQAVLSDEDVPTANALIMFSQCLGGSLGLSIAQNIFSSELVKGLRGIDGVDVQMVVNAGASDVVRVVEGLGVEVVQKVLEAYNGGLTKAFWLAVAGAGLAMVCSFGIENRNLKGKKQ
jgi:MFS family permease